MLFVLFFFLSLKGLQLLKMDPRPMIIDVLIGLDCTDLHYSYRDIRGNQGNQLQLPDLPHSDGHVLVLCIYVTSVRTVNSFTRTYVTSD